MLVEITKNGRAERPCVTSLDVAQTFGKSHQHVLRDVRSLECSDEFRLSNFGQSSYVNAQGKNQPKEVIRCRQLNLKLSFPFTSAGKP